MVAYHHIEYAALYTIKNGPLLYRIQNERVLLTVGRFYYIPIVTTLLHYKELFTPIHNESGSNTIDNLKRLRTTGDAVEFYHPFRKRPQLRPDEINPPVTYIGSGILSLIYIYSNA